MQNNKRCKKMKVRIVSGVLCFCLATTSLMYSPSESIYADNNISIYINGQALKTDKECFILNGRTFVPIRAVVEELGANVEWDEVYRTVSITKGDSNIKLYIDNRLFGYKENSQMKYDVSDVAPIIKNDTTYVPLRLVGNALGLDVSWNDTTKTVSVSEKTNANTTVPKFFDISFANLCDGQTINNQIEITLNGISSLPKNASQIKYLFLNSTTGEGKIIARTADITKPATLIPSIDNQGQGILAAVVCDNSGNFLAGTCINVNIKVNPEVTLSGITENQVISSSVSLTTKLSFRAYAIKYEFTYADGSVVTTDELDPYGTYTYTPSISKNGNVSIRAIALDSNGKTYSSSYTKATIQMPTVITTPYVKLKSFDTSNVGKIPVTLSISRNFDVDTTEYYAQNIDTGKTVLLYKVGWGDYSWFPGPSSAGNWKVYVKVINSKDKQAYYSNAITVTIPNTQNLVIQGIGPNQVITGQMTLSSICNVPIKDVSYIISNPYNGTEKILGTETSTSTKVTYTPNYINEGKRYIQAIATTTDGNTIKSEKIEVTIYLGELYTSKPITTKDNFINFVTPLALKTQKENGMSAALQIAQAILETGWGQSIPVDKYTGLFSYNLFGIKGTGNAGSVICSTWEEYYGTVYRVDDKFRAYNSAQDSWDDHNALLLTRERYIPYTEVMFDSTSGAYALKRCGYATDSGYPGKLIYLIERYGLDKLDYQKI